MYSCKFKHFYQLINIVFHEHFSKFDKIQVTPRHHLSIYLTIVQIINNNIISCEYGSSISYRCGKEPKEQVRIVLVADGKITGIADDSVRMKQFNYSGQLLGPYDLPVTNVRGQQQWFGGQMRRGGLRVPQRVCTPQIERCWLRRQTRSPLPHATPGGATHEYDTKRGAAHYVLVSGGDTARTVSFWFLFILRPLAAACDQRAPQCTRPFGYTTPTSDEEREIIAVVVALSKLVSRLYYTIRPSTYLIRVLCYSELWIIRSWRNPLKTYREFELLRG